MFHFAPQPREGNVLTSQDLAFLRRQQQGMDGLYPDLIPLPPSGDSALMAPPPPTLCLDDDLRNLPVTWPAGGPRLAPPPDPNATVTIIPGARPPFGPGSGRKFGAPR